MATFVVLLRGVNVSGKNKLPMAELRAVAETAGLLNVRTYVQSGNLIFDTKGTAKSVEKQIRSLILDKFGFDVPTIVKTARQWSEIASANPYVDKGIDPKQLYVAFAARQTVPSDAERLNTIKLASDTYSLRGTEIYLNLVSGAGRTKLTNNAIEKKLDLVATTRNWRTVGKIESMI